MPIVYDIETYPNIFTLSAIGCDTDDAVTYEISEWRDDREALLEWLYRLQMGKVEMVGFNNVGFDYPVIDVLLRNQSASFTDLYGKATSIIQGDRWEHTIWPNDRRIPQLDLFMIHHFNNVARATSLKALQFNMRSDSVEDLPIKPGTYLTRDQVPIIRNYNAHDVTETREFYKRSLGQIDFRRALSERYNRDFMNHNDTKIGKDYFIMRLEEMRPGSCYTSNPRQPVQTHRSEIRLADVVLPYIKFQHPEMQRVHAWFMQQVITDTKGVFTDVNCEINGFQFDFGTGGIHGSVQKRLVRADDEYALIDLDVTSFYPNIAIVNHLYPAHLGELFVNIYSDVMAQRREYKKGTPENAMLKLALNGVYGDSNNVYSPFYDPQYTMSITVNGQLLLCMLAERLMLAVPGIEMIQVNTDGLTIRVKRDLEWLVNEISEWWQSATGLALERADYTMMYIRDVNNYLAVDEKGKVKRKGAYESALPGDRNPLGWHQDCSALIVPKAAEAAIVHGYDVETWIRDQTDEFDFMLRAKVPRASHLMHGDVEVQSTTRYYVSTDGAPLCKVSPPADDMPVGQFKRASKVGLREYLEWHRINGNVYNPNIHTKNKSTYEERRMQIQAGWLASICNKASDFRWENLNYDWYVGEAKKLLPSSIG